MRTKPFSQTAFPIPRIVLALLLSCSALFLAFFSFAANPASGTIAASAAN